MEKRTSKDKKEQILNIAPYAIALIWSLAISISSEIMQYKFHQAKVEKNRKEEIDDYTKKTYDIIKEILPEIREIDCHRIGKGIDVDTTHYLLFD